MLGLGAALSTICFTTPCLAQDATSFAHSNEQRTGAYGGVNLRLEFGRNRRPIPVARIALGLTQETRGGGAYGTRRNAMPALELGLKKSGGAELFVAGQSTARLDRRLGANALGLGTVETVILVAAAAFGVYLVLSLNDLGDAVPKF
jgi:hypothetical protein